MSRIYWDVVYLDSGAGALVQWLKLPAWKVRDRELVPCSGIQVSKKQNVSSTLTRKRAILWGDSVIER